MITTLVGAAEPEPRPTAAAWTIGTGTTATMAVTWSVGPAEETVSGPARPPYRTTAYVRRPVPEIEA